jgi:thioredoxin 1|nr:thioredoxin family protein [Kiritimatiellia bacterium]
VNVDNAKATAQTFGIRSIPTLVVLKDGKTVKSFTGLTQADALVAAVKEAL